jgi:hypothetical protein
VGVWIWWHAMQIHNAHIHPSCRYLSDRGNRALMQRLEPTLQPGTRIVSNFFSVAGWEHMLTKTCTADPATGPLHLYVYQKHCKASAPC